jgi:hypothetical protein
LISPPAPIVTAYTICCSRRKDSGARGSGRRGLGRPGAALAYSWLTSEPAPTGESRDGQVEWHLRDSLTRRNEDGHAIRLSGSRPDARGWTRASTRGPGGRRGGLPQTAAARASNFNPRLGALVSGFREPDDRRRCGGALDQVDSAPCCGYSGTPSRISRPRLHASRIAAREPLDYRASAGAEMDDGLVRLQAGSGAGGAPGNLLWRDVTFCGPFRGSGGRAGLGHAARMARLKGQRVAPFFSPRAARQFLFALDAETGGSCGVEGPQS